MMITDKNGWVRIPKFFMDDHADRGLDTPEVKKATSRHYWIDQGDPAIVELVDDALYYSKDVDACGMGLVAASRALLDAMR